MAGVLGAGEAAFMDVLGGIGDFGVSVVLLAIFVLYFLRKAKDDDSRVKQAYDEYLGKIDEGNKLLRDREDTLLAEGAKREEIIRQEAEKRENLIRKEAEKRESMLMVNQDRMMSSLEKMSESMEKIQLAIGNMEVRHEADIGQIKDQMNKLESKIDKIG